MKKKAGETDRGLSRLLVSVVAAFVVLVGCMQAVYVPWRPGDNETMVNRLANETFHVIRFKTSGGSDDQVLWGYLLYRDGVVIRRLQPEQELGKMTLKDVLADQQKRTYASLVARGAMIQEFYENGLVVAYSVNDIRLSVDLWRDPAGAESGKMTFTLSYTDARTKADDGSVQLH
jgi:hypothetical protein